MDTSEMDKTNSQQEKGPRKCTRIREPLIHTLRNPLKH